MVSYVYFLYVQLHTFWMVSASTSMMDQFSSTSLPRFLFFSHKNLRTFPVLAFAMSMKASDDSFSPSNPSPLYALPFVSDEF